MKIKMSKTIKIICDRCSKDISYSFSKTEYRYIVRCEEVEVPSSFEHQPINFVENYFCSKGCIAQYFDLDGV